MISLSLMTQQGLYSVGTHGSLGRCNVHRIGLGEIFALLSNLAPFISMIHAKGASPK